jgi:hypothetical protein
MSAALMPCAANSRTSSDFVIGVCYGHCPIRHIHQNHLSTILVVVSPASAEVPSSEAKLIGRVSGRSREAVVVVFVALRFDSQCGGHRAVFASVLLTFYICAQRVDLSTTFAKK